MKSKGQRILLWSIQQIFCSSSNFAKRLCSLVSWDFSFRICPSPYTIYIIIVHIYIYIKCSCLTSHLSPLIKKMHNSSHEQQQSTIISLLLSFSVAAAAILLFALMTIMLAGEDDGIVLPLLAFYLLYHYHHHHIHIEHHHHHPLHHHLHLVKPIAWVSGIRCRQMISKRKNERIHPSLPSIQPYLYIFFIMCWITSSHTSRTSHHQMPSSSSSLLLLLLVCCCCRCCSKTLSLGFPGEIKTGTWPSHGREPGSVFILWGNGWGGWNGEECDGEGESFVWGAKDDEDESGRDVMERKGKMGQNRKKDERTLGPRVRHLALSSHDDRWIVECSWIKGSTPVYIHTYTKGKEWIRLLLRPIHPLRNLSTYPTYLSNKACHTYNQ